MPVCIGGMHRSGTSMVTNLLHRCGLYLGGDADLIPATPDNTSGHWENRRFTNINEDIIKELRGTWYSPPPMDQGWNKESIQEIRRRAGILISEFSSREPWGWKDPRNCLTLPVWISLLPDMKIVICLRNPLEVTHSLRRREVFKYSPGNTLWRGYKQIRSALSIRRRRFFSQLACLKLWQTYNERILQYTIPQRRIVTHYEAHLREPLAELRRLLRFLDMAVPERVIKEAAAATSGNLRHNLFTTDDLAKAGLTDVSKLYLSMCEEAAFVSNQSDCALNTLLSRR